MITLIRKKTFALSLISLLILTPIAEAKSQEDPCNNLPGKWKGSGELYGAYGWCKWDAEVTFTKYANTVQMTWDVYNNRGDVVIGSCGPEKDKWTKIGTCKNALMKFDTGKGTVFGNSIVIQLHGFQGMAETHLVRQ